MSKTEPNKDTFVWLNSLSKIKSGRDLVLFAKLFPDDANKYFFSKQKVDDTYFYIKNEIENMELTYDTCPKTAPEMNALLQICERYLINANYFQILIDAIADKNFDICHEFFKKGLYVRPDLKDKYSYHLNAALMNMTKQEAILFHHLNLLAMTDSGVYKTEKSKIVYLAIVYFTGEESLHYLPDYLAEFINENTGQSELKEKKLSELLNLVSYAVRDANDINKDKFFNEIAPGIIDKEIVDEVEKIIYNEYPVESSIKETSISYIETNFDINDVPIRDIAEEDLKDQFSYFTVIDNRRNKFHFLCKDTSRKNSKMIEKSCQSTMQNIPLDETIDVSLYYVLTWLIYLFSEEDFVLFIKNFNFAYFEYLISIMSFFDCELFIHKIKIEVFSKLSQINDFDDERLPYFGQASYPFP